MSAAARAGASLAARRLTRRPAALVVLLGVALTISSALIERATNTTGVADRVLHAAFGLVVPLSAFALTTLALRGGSLDEATWCLARFGHPRRLVAAGLVGTTLVATAIATWLPVAAGLAVAYGGHAQGLADGVTSSWIAALGGAAYGAMFCAASAFGRRGRGRAAALAGDLLLGGGAGFLALPWPGSHLQNLLGGVAPHALSQATSSAVLAVGAALLTVLAMARAGN